MNITVALVEDDSDLRDSIVRYVGGTPGFACVGAFGNAEEALLKIPKLLPNVVLMDINLPGMSGIQGAARLKVIAPSVPIVMLTVYEDSNQVFQALAAGACGYLVKSASPEKLLEAIREVRGGGSPMSSHIARKVVESFQSLGVSAQNAENLSAREQQVLQRLAEGLSYKQIADKMAISIDTVRTYIRRTYEKLHVRSRSEAIVKFLQK
jgi:DNA-binding NarL/FixJ family response regulator